MDNIRQVTGESRRIYLLVGLLIFAVLSVFAVVYFKERIIFVDAAYQLVYMILNKRPYVMPIRFGELSYQLITQAAIWARFDLKPLMIVDSLSSLIFGCFCLLLAYRFSERNLMFFMIPVIFILFANDTFYWPMPDTQLGLIWLCLYAAFLCDEKWVGKIWAWPVHIFCIWWVQMSHLLVFLPLLLLVIYYYGKLSRLLTFRAIIHISICLAAFVLRYYLARHNKYESGKLEIWGNIKYLSQLTVLPSVQIFLIKVQTIYSMYLFCFLAGAAWLLYKRKYIKALAIIGFSIAHWLIVMLAYAHDQSIYLENLLIPLSFMAALPFLADIIPAYPVRRMVPFVLVVVIIRLGFIYHAHFFFTERLHMYDPYLEYTSRKNRNGIFVNENHLKNKDKYYMLWASGYESILLSSLVSPDSCMMIQFVPNEKKYLYTRGLDGQLVTIHMIKEENEIPARYFKLRWHGYEVISDTTQLK